MTCEPAQRMRQRPIRPRVCSPKDDGQHTYRLVVGHREPITPETVQHLMVQQLLFHRIVQVHVLVEEQVFLEQEYVTVFAYWLGRAGRARVGVPVPFPFRHDVGQLFLGYQTPLGVAQHFVDGVP